MVGILGTHSHKSKEIKTITYVGRWRLKISLSFNNISSLLQWRFTCRHKAEGEGGMNWESGIDIIYTIPWVKQIASGKLLYSRESSAPLWWPKEVECGQWEGGSRRGGYIYTYIHIYMYVYIYKHVDDLHCCTAETNTAL